MKFLYGELRWNKYTSLLFFEGKMRIVSNRLLLVCLCMVMAVSFFIQQKVVNASEIRWATASSSANLPFVENIDTLENLTTDNTGGSASVASIAQAINNATGKDLTENDVVSLGNAFGFTTDTSQANAGDIAVAAAVASTLPENSGDSISVTINPQGGGVTMTSSVTINVGNGSTSAIDTVLITPPVPTVDTTTTPVIQGSVTIPQDTVLVQDNGENYNGPLAPPVQQPAPENIAQLAGQTAVVVSMGNPSQRINFDPPIIMQFNVTFPASQTDGVGTGSGLRLYLAEVDETTGETHFTNIPVTVTRLDSGEYQVESELDHMSTYVLGEKIEGVPDASGSTSDEAVSGGSSFGCFILDILKDLY